MKKLPDADILRQLFSYDASTGVLTYNASRGHIGAGSVAGTILSTGYCIIVINYEKFQRSRIVWKYIHGSDPVGFIDHINRVRNDDRIENLRECEGFQNNGNSKISSRNTSGMKGVSYRKDRNKWRAFITMENKYIHLGHFDNPDDAHKAYKESAKKYFGKFANTK